MLIVPLAQRILYKQPCMSLLIILWGTKSRDDARGKVVDICPSCNSIREFVVHERYQVGHLYFISLGGWRKVSASRTCTVCSQTFPCVPARYKKIVPIDIANKLSFDDLLKQSNAFLAAQGADADKSKINAATNQASAKRSPASYSALRAKLEALDEASSEREFLAGELSFWKKLNAAQRENLRERIDAFYLEQSRLKFARDFLETLTQHWPNSIAAGRAALLIVATIVALAILFVFIGLIVFANRSDLAQFMGVYGFVVFGGLIGAILFYRSSLKAVRVAWIRDHCAANAASDGFVDREALAQVLDEPVNHDEWDPDRIRIVFATRPFKQEILQQLQRVPAPKEKPPRSEAVRKGIRSK
jgi:hypothetical protein